MSDAPPPGPDSQPLNYAPPESSSPRKTVLGIIVGIFGYLGLLVGSYIFAALFAPTPHGNASLLAWMAIILVPPLLAILLVAHLTKSKPMAIAAIITFGTIALSCTGCAMLIPY